MSRGQYLTSVASSVPFDNSTDTWVAENVQAAIEEAPIHLRATEVNATGTITAGTGSDTLMTGMTLTPAAGTYLVFFSCDVNANAAGNATSVSFYVGGTQKASSLRKIVPGDGGALSGAARACIAINSEIAVNGTQAIEVRWSSSAGTNTAAARSLNILRCL